MTEATETAVAEKPWPLFGYAPGRYICKCAKCNEVFEGDKRAVMCLECAARSANKALRDVRRTAVVGEETPVAWRWRFPGSDLWNFTDDEEHAHYRKTRGDNPSEVQPLYTRSPTGGREAGLEAADRIVREEWNSWAKTAGVSTEALVASILNRIRALPDSGESPNGG